MPLNPEPAKPTTHAEASSASTRTRTNSLFAKMKAIEARAIERLKRRRAQESPPFPPQAPETAAPQPAHPKV